jgi:hypothetical protein
MKFPLNEKFLRWALDTVGEEEFARQMERDYRALCGAASQEDLSENLGLRPNSLRGQWDRLLEIKARKIARTAAGDINIPLLLDFLTLVKFPVEICAKPRPWDRWQDGDQVVAVIGERYVRIDEVSRTVRQRAVGARDAEALALLSGACYGQMKLNADIGICHVSSRLPATDAAKKLRELRAGKKTGMIVVLGSPVVNPLAEPIAEAILRDGDKVITPPAKFRWAFETPGSGSLLSEPPQQPDKDGQQRWRPEQEGIAVHQAHEEEFFPRTPDDLIASDAAGGRWPDCGILMIDCRSRPYLVLCAGHGGAGTLAAVKALRDDQQLIAQLLEASPHAITGSDRVFAVVTADRVRETNLPPTAERTDDLKLSASRVAWASAVVPNQSW